MPCGAKVLAVGHHAWRNGAWWRRLDVLVDDLPINAFAVAFAVADVDVVVLVDVVVVAVADIRVEIAVCIFRCAGVSVLVDVRHRPRIDVRILVDVGHRARILVDVGVG